MKISFCINTFKPSKKDLLFPAEPLLKWQRVTLTLLFVHIIQDC